MRGCSGSSFGRLTQGLAVVVAARFRRPVEQAGRRAPHVAGAGDRGNAELARDDIVRQRCDVVLGDHAGDLFAEPGTEKAPQMAGDVLPAFDSGPHFAVRLADRRPHPLDPLLDDFVDGLAPSCLLRLVLAEGFGARRSACALQAVDPAAGVLDSEGLGVVDAKPAGSLLAGLRVGELEREGRHASRGDADVEAGAFAVVNLDPAGDPLFAHAVGQDDAAIARALASGFGGDDSIHCGFGS